MCGDWDGGKNIPAVDEVGAAVVSGQVLVGGPEEGVDVVIVEGFVVGVDELAWGEEALGHVAGAIAARGALADLPHLVHQGRPQLGDSGTHGQVQVVPLGSRVDALLLRQGGSQPRDVGGHRGPVRG